MEYTREDYEGYLNAVAFRDIDGEKDPVALQTEQRRFVQMLVEYYRKFRLREDEFCNYGLELVETAGSCMKNYDAAHGAFVNYFAASLSRRIRKEKAIQKEDSVRRGLRISEKDDRLIRKILEYAKHKNVSLDDEEALEEIARSLNVKPDAVKRAIRINAETAVLSDTVEDKDGDAYSLIDEHAAEDDVESGLAERESAANMIAHIDAVYNALPQRENTRRLYSLWATSHILDSFGLLADKDLPGFAGAGFVSEDAIAFYKSEKRVMTDSQIAAACGVSPQSASRTFRGFKEKLAGLGKDD